MTGILTAEKTVEPADQRRRGVAVAVLRLRCLLAPEKVALLFLTALVVAPGLPRRAYSRDKALLI
jgi:hypothetical protein